MKNAYSYIRFSSPEQAKGDSFRRQSEKAEDWATKNGYRIVKSWEDAGVSSYRGQNATKGGFAEFLRAAHAGELPPDSVLLVENLDRVSREKPRKALSRFLDLIDTGIAVVTLTDGVKYDAASVDDDKTGMQLFGSLMIMIRANGESRLKGERVAAAWERKRLAARDKSHRLSLGPAENAACARGSSSLTGGRCQRGTSAGVRSTSRRRCVAPRRRCDRYSHRG